MTTTANMGKKMILSTAAASFALSAPIAVGAATVDTNAKRIKIDTTQILHYGSNGKAVKSLQIQLQQKNYYQDSIDGIYGPHTLGAVTRYQQNHRLAVDGIAGPRTLSTLFTVEGNYVQSERLLSIGDRGQAVRAAQEKLQKLGYYSYNVDGIFGTITRDAVRHFQAANDLSIDGIIGPKTHQALFGTNPEEASDVQTLSVSAPPSTSNSTGLVADAKQLIGSPYQWGGTSPSGFDCSGFINYVFQENGVNVPRSTSSIWNYGIPIDNPQAGDLVFFETYKAGPSHVGIYLGSGQFVHAGSDGVEISELSLDYWRSRYLGAKRIVQN